MFDRSFVRQLTAYAVLAGIFCLVHSTAKAQAVIAQYGDGSLPAINNLDQLVYYTTSSFGSNPRTSNYHVMLAAGGSGATEIASFQEVVTMNGPFPSATGLRPTGLSINDQGQVAIAVSSDNTSTDPAKVYLWDQGSLNTLYSSQAQRLVHISNLNNSGQVAVQSFLSIFVADSGGLRTITTTNGNVDNSHSNIDAAGGVAYTAFSPIPGQPGVQTQTIYQPSTGSPVAINAPSPVPQPAGSLSLNDLGLAAYIVENPNASQPQYLKQGDIYLAGPSLPAQLLVAAPTGYAPRVVSLNNNGVVVFEADSTSGGNAIFAKLPGSDPVLLLQPGQSLLGGTIGSLGLGGTNALNDQGHFVVFTGINGGPNAGLHLLVVAVPEASSLILGGAAVVGFAAVAYRRRKSDRAAVAA